jgi:hypothetical protein
MGREYAYAYKSNARPYGQPKDNFHESTPRPESVGLNRNVRQVMDTSVNVASPEVTKCSSLTRKGDPCKGRPPAGGDLCNFHRK